MDNIREAAELLIDQLRATVQLAWWFRVILTVGFGGVVPIFPAMTFGSTLMFSLLWVATYIATLFGF